MTAARILSEWRCKADRLIHRDHNLASTDEIVELNRLAIEYAEETGKTVPLIGRDDYTPKGGDNRCRGSG